MFSGRELFVICVIENRNMSTSGSGRESLTLSDLQEWFVAMGLEIEAESEGSTAEQLRDGVLLCQLINKIKCSSVEVVSLVLSSCLC